MQPLINCQSVTAAYGADPLFTGISLTLGEGERLGLIGPNGSGKSTLLKLLSGALKPEAGEVSIRKDLNVVYLPQTENPNSTDSLEQHLFRSLASVDIEDQERYARVKKWLARAGFSDSNQEVGNLSGGWRKRLSIISRLVLEPELLLLDEPTNHLDIEGICWLEELLENAPFAFILVTHDRYFLENVTKRIIELNPRYPKGILEVAGSYSDFLLHREAVLDNQLQLENILANKVRRETEWLNRGPKARTSKAKYRIEEAYRLRDEFSSVRKRNLQDGRVAIDFDATRRKTRKLLTASNISKSLGGSLLFSELDIVLSPGRCLGLLGRNGTGKSTLVHILAGRLAPDSGEVKTADDVRIVLFDQNREQLDLSLTLKQALAPAGDSVIFKGRSVHVASWAKRFQFEPEKLELPVSQLSGGEQARILIARLMLQPADILLLDEPTNDLDITTLEILESSLVEFPGAVILVTHDRFMLDRLADSVIGFDGKGNADHYADYNQWLETLNRIEVEKKSDRKKTVKPKQKVRKLSYKEKMELDSMEQDIQAVEAEAESYQQKLQDPSVMNDPAELQRYCDLLQESQEKVENLYNRWEELEALRDR